MNCKPGDLALVVIGPESGKLLEVLYAAPPYIFRLPDGHLNEAGRPEDWVVRVLGSKIKVPRIPGRFAEYGTARDSYLRPLPGLTQEQREEAFA